MNNLNIKEMFYDRVLDETGLIKSAKKVKDCIVSGVRTIYRGMFYRTEPCSTEVSDTENAVLLQLINRSSYTSSNSTSQSSSTDAKNTQNESVVQSRQDNASGEKIDQDKSAECSLRIRNEDATVFSNGSLPYDFSNQVRNSNTEKNPVFKMDTDECDDPFSNSSILSETTVSETSPTLSSGAIESGEKENSPSINGATVKKSNDSNKRIGGETNEEIICAVNEILMCLLDETSTLTQCEESSTCNARDDQSAESMQLDHILTSLQHCSLPGDSVQKEEFMKGLCLKKCTTKKHESKGAVDDMTNRSDSALKKRKRVHFSLPEEIFDEGRRKIPKKCEASIPTRSCMRSKTVSAGDEDLEKSDLSSSDENQFSSEGPSETPIYQTKRADNETRYTQIETICLGRENFKIERVSDFLKHIETEDLSEQTKENSWDLSLQTKLNDIIDDEVKCIVTEIVCLVYETCEQTECEGLEKVSESSKLNAKDDDTYQSNMDGENGCIIYDIESLVDIPKRITTGRGFSENTEDDISDCKSGYDCDGGDLIQTSIIKSEDQNIGQRKRQCRRSVSVDQCNIMEIVHARKAKVKAKFLIKQQLVYKTQRKTKSQRKSNVLNE